MMSAEPFYRLVPKRRGPAPKASCCVYLVGSGAEITKIGMTNNPPSRLAGLRTSSHENLSLEQVWRVETRDQAAALEKRLHGLFAWAKVRREWYGVEARYVRSVGSHLLVGDEDKAAELASSLSHERQASRALNEAWRRMKLMHPRWDRADREDLRQQIDAAEAEQDRWYREALALGLEPSELDLWRESKERRR